MNDDENFFEEEELKTRIKKIGEIFSGEIKLIRTILISCLTVIIICILLYFNYILIGQFFTTIFLSFIVNLALKPTKEKVTATITNYFMKKKYFTVKSRLFIIVKYIIRGVKVVISIFRRGVEMIKRRRDKNLNRVESYKDLRKGGKEYLKLVNSPAISTRKSSMSNMDDTSSTVTYITIFNNRTYLICLLIIYVAVFKLEFNLSLTLLILYILLDFIIRFLIDTTFSLIRLANRNFYFKNLIFEHNELNENMHSLISLIIIGFFSVIIMLTLMVFLWLLFIDMRQMVIYIRNNNDYLHYFKNILPEHIKDYYSDGSDSSAHTDSNVYSNKVFVHLKSIEAYINSTVEEQFGSEIARGNHTLYDISNNVINFLKDPSLMIMGKDSAKSKEYPLISLLDEKCDNYSKEMIYRLVSFTRVNYVKRLYCGLRILIERFNLDFSISIFSKYLKQGYNIFIKSFNLIAGSIFLNLLSLSLELINSLMLSILFITCLFNFLRMKGDLIKDLLKFLPYPENQINEIHKSFHNSLQGVFVSTFDIFLYHTLLTWLIFDFCDIKFVFLFSTIAGIITLIPIITPWIVLIPANIFNFIDDDISLVKISLFNISYYLLINFADNDIYKRNVKKSDPYVTGLSFVMGMYTFGFKGIIYGPVLLCVSITVMDIIKILIK